MFSSVAILAILLACAAGCRPSARVSPSDSPRQSFQNPVIARDFADPGIIRVGETYYAYSTNSSGANVPMARSDDLVHWEWMGDVMPALPSWVRFGLSHVWAPEVIEVDGHYLLYYTARAEAPDLQCIGVATSDHPEGIFRPQRDGPLVCQTEYGGSIDASPFRDADGTLYLYWKNDGNCCGMPTHIWVQQMSADGLGLAGEPVQLLRNRYPWEGHVIEAPTMWRHAGGYYLFYSGNAYDRFEYAVGYARCDSPTGPCMAAEGNPILAGVAGSSPVIGPGHQTIVQTTDGDLWLAYHAWEVTPDGGRGDSRHMWLDRLTWEDEHPVILGPTVDTQLAP
jgi:beta-xylosidase